jgi:hypothetical protein
MDWSSHPFLGSRRSDSKLVKSLLRRAVAWLPCAMYAGLTKPRARERDSGVNMSLGDEHRAPMQ